MLSEAAAVCRIFISPSARLQWGWARRAPLLPPPVCLLLHMLGTGISQHVHHIQGASELLCGWATAHPCSVSTLLWPAQKKNLFAQSDFSTKAKLAEILRDHCCYCPKSLGKGILGTLLLHRALQLDISPLQPLPSSTSLYVEREKIAALKEREKKMRLRSQGHFNKHQT